MPKRTRSAGESVVAALITFSILRQLSKSKKGTQLSPVVVRPGESAVGALGLPYHLYVEDGDQVDKVYWEGPDGQEMPPVLTWENRGSYVAVTLNKRGSVIFAVVSKKGKKHGWVLAA